MSPAYAHACNNGETVKSFGFEASALHRTALGVGFVAAAALLVWLIERPWTATLPDSAQAEVPMMVQVPVTIESTFPVASWSVSLLGVEQAATHHDAFSWSGRIASGVGESLLVQAQAVAADQAPHHGLRLLVGSAPERLVWGDGEVTATVELSK